MNPLGVKQGTCTGCAACVAICPSDSITMQADVEGFQQPEINLPTCTDCDVCRQTCPVNQKAPSIEQNTEAGGEVFPKVFAAWHLNENIRRESSSGGIFTALAENILTKGGIVAGAAFDNKLEVRHILVDAVTALYRLRGSKYVQSEISPDIYRNIREVLKLDRLVLFSGTPCQVAGLYAFLGKDYQNLFTCDIVCHGVPSPKVFASYKTIMERQYGGKAKRIAFRRKDCGWKRFSVSMSFDNDTEYLRVFNADPFMLGFLRNICLRSSCHSCRFSRLPRVADITLGDFWGVGHYHPEWDDDSGTSLILVNTKKGSKAFDACRDVLVVHEADLNEAIRSNPCICGPVPAGVHRGEFFNDLNQIPFEIIIKKYMSLPPQIWRIAGSVKNRVYFGARKLIKIVLQ
jgi:coenzyme F420-reducing hydrogenase beta subunit